MMMMKMTGMANKLFTKFVNITPFFLVILSGVFAYASNQGWYSEYYRYLGDMVGYSIITNLVFLKHYNRKEFCNPTKVCVYGLLFMNIVNLLVNSGIIMGRFWYDIAISFLVILILITGYIKRW